MRLFFMPQLSELYSKLYSVFPGFESTDFVIGLDSFEDIKIDHQVNSEEFWYFKNSKKTLIKRFVLKKTVQIEKSCLVTLIKKPNGKFTPRFEFQIWDTTKKTFESFVPGSIENKFIKAKVSFNDCHEQFMELLQYVLKIPEIDFDSDSYSVIDTKKKELIEIFGGYNKLEVLGAVQKKFGTEFTENDADMLLNRKDKLELFRRLLEEPNFFDQMKVKLNKTDELLWQYFFEKNSWIFGYGLQLVSCENLEDKSLRQMVVGNSFFGGSGKEADALLKTRGAMSKFLFCEIKQHHVGKLMEPYRAGVFSPAKDLKGGVAQVQRTIQKASLIVKEQFRPTDSSGDLTGEEILFVRPRGVVVIGSLKEFLSENGPNYDKLASFEIYRQQINGIEIITYDELYERAKFIVDPG